MTQIKILRVTVTNHLSIGKHLRDVIYKCGQSLNAITVLHSHGMCNNAMKDIYRAAVLDQLLYASPAWWGFAITSDIKRIEAFVHRGVQLSLYGNNDPTPTVRLNSLRTPMSLFKKTGTTSIMSCNSSFQTFQLQLLASTSQVHIGHKN